jgi:hypothetical protein
MSGEDEICKTDSENFEISENSMDDMSRVEKPRCINLNGYNNFMNNLFISSTANIQEGSQKRRRNIHSTFLLLKKKLNLEQFMRKTQIDSLLKKCKSKAFKTIHEALKKCLNIKLPRLPQNFITNIKIDFNKVYLDKTIYDIYREFKIIPSVEEFLSKKYLIDDKVQIFRDFLNLTFKNVFEYYVNSKQYVKDYYHIMNREGEKFAILFNYISKVFIQYYTKSKGNKPKLRSDSEGNKKQVENGEGMDVDPENLAIPEQEFEVKKFKRKPLFKRIKVKRVSMKKKNPVNILTETKHINFKVVHDRKFGSSIFQIIKLKKESQVEITQTN